MKDLKLKCEYKILGLVTYIEGSQPKGEEFNESRRVDFRVDALEPEIQTMCLQYGLRAILADRTSDAKRLGINKLDWMSEVYAQLADGQWEAKRESKGSVDRALVHLIVELKGCTAIEAEAALKHASKDFKTQLAERYDEELARIRAEMNKPAIDLTDL